MKKNTKKKLTSLLLVTGLSVVSLISISATLSKRNNGTLNLNGNYKAIENNGFQINSDKTITIAQNVEALKNLQPNVKNINAYTSVPNGFAFQMGQDGASNYIVSIDQNDPSKVLWYDSIGANTETLTILYTPYYDTLLVLFRDGGNNFNNGLSPETQATIKLRIYKNISNSNGGVKKSSDSEIDIINYTYQGDMDRGDLWAIIPITESNSWNEKTNVYKFLIYKKGWNDSSNQVIYQYNLESNSIRRTVNLNLNEDGNKQAILGAKSFCHSRIQGIYHFWVISFLRAIDAGDGSGRVKLVIDYHVLKEDNPNGQHKDYSVEVSTEEDLYLFNDDNYLNIIKSFTNQSGTHLDNATNVDYIYYKNNFFVNLKNSANEFRPMFIQNQYALTCSGYGYISCDNISTKPLFTDALNNSEINILGGQFDNSFAMNEIISVNSGSNKILSPFVGIGYSEMFKTTNLNGYFTFVIKPIWDANYNIPFNENTNSEILRIYPFAADANISNGYSPLQNTQNNDYSFTQLAQTGFPLLNYSNSSEVVFNPFEHNIMQIGNGLNKSLIINQEGRGQITNNTPSYGYWTRINNNVINLGMSQMSSSDVTVLWLIDKFNFDKPYYEGSYTNQLGMFNFPVDSIITINQNSLSIHNGYIEFDLYATSLYNSDGHYLKSTLENLKQSWNSNFLISRIKVEGFKTLDQTEQLLSKLSVNMNTIIPTSYWTGAKDDNKIKELIFNNRTQIFKDLPSDFSSNNIFIYQVVPDNTKGIIGVKFTINKWYEIGNVVEKESNEFALELIDFKIILPTTINSNVALNGLSNIKSTDYINNVNFKSNFRYLIFENRNEIIKNLPDDFSLSNLWLDGDAKANNVEGSITQQITINNYYNENGLQTNNNLNSTIKIYGFKIDDLTTWCEGGKLNSVDDIFPSDWEENQELIKQAIIDSKLITNLFVNNLRASDIELSNVSWNNIIGEIITDITIKNGIGQIDGVQTETITIYQVTFTGFKVNNDVATNIINDNVTIPNVSSYSPSEYATEDVWVNFIFNNRNTLFKRIPDDFSINNIQIDEMIPTDREGKMEISFSLNKYYNDQNELIDSDNFNKKFTINFFGFKKTSATIFPDNNAVFEFGSDDISPSDFYENNDQTNLKKLVLSSIDKIFSNLPIDFSENNIIISNVSLNNSEGVIKFDLSINKWYDSEGVLKTTNSPIRNISIHGFKKQVETILPLNNALYNLGVPNQTANEFWNNNNTNIQRLIFENKEIIFQNLPSDFNQNNINILDVKILNKEGQIKILFNINNYFLSNGIQTDSNSSTRTIIISNFKMDNENKNVGTIVGGVILLIGGLILFGILCWFIYKNRSK